MTTIKTINVGTKVRRSRLGYQKRSVDENGSEYAPGGKNATIKFAIYVSERHATDV